MIHRPDQAIDTVLAALRQTEPPAGMERRLVEALESHAAQPPVSAWRRWTRLASPSHPRTAYTLAALIVLAGLSAITLKHPLHPHRSARVPATAQPDQDILATHPRQPTPGNTERAATSPRQPAPQIATTKPGRRSSPSTRNPESLELSEMHAPSQPAPPIPLTRQEQLLRRVAHRADPEPMTALNGELRARQEAEQQADFDKFFGKLNQPAPSQSE